MATVRQWQPKNVPASVWAIRYDADLETKFAIRNWCNTNIDERNNATGTELSIINLHGIWEDVPYGDYIVQIGDPKSGLYRVVDAAEFEASYLYTEPF